MTRAYKIIALIVASMLFTPTLAMAIETKAKQAILVDDNSGVVLFEKNADELMHPSSMSKLMTIYMLFTRLKEGGLKLSDTFPVSEKAWRMQGSKSWVELGNNIPVEALIQGIVIQSGNDSCIVVAEGLSGSEEAFAKEMNKKALEIGLKNSHFINATGWPDDGHLMTARDLSILAHRIIHDFPEYYHYFAEKEFTWHNIRQPNRNLLLNSTIGVDGLKTGHTEVAGYGIVASAKQGDRRIIVAVNGLGDEKERAQEAEALLRAGFRDFENVTLVKKGTAVETAEVWMGKAPSVKLVAGEDMLVNIPRTEKKNIHFTLVYQGPVAAPVQQGAHIADLKVEVPGRKPVMLPLLAGETVDKAGPFARITPAFLHYVLGR